MNVWLGILLLVVTINPPRRRSELSGDRTVVVAGAALTFLVLSGVGVVADGLLDTLDISAPTFRVAVGLVLVVRGIVDLLTPLPPPGGELPGMKAAIAPVFFPVLFRPELGLVSISVAVDGGLGTMAVGAAAGLLLVVWWVARLTDWSYDRAASRLFSTVLIALAVDRLVDGVFAF